MSGYGFGKKRSGTSSTEDGAAADKLDLTGISRSSLSVDPAREAEAIRRGAEMGFVDRGTAPALGRRRPPVAPQKSVYIKGPADTLNWFIEYANERGHRSYWTALEELRMLVEKG